MKDFYEVLDVPISASDEDIKKAYKKLALKWHPDKNPNNLEEAKEQFQLIRQAYDTLSNPDSRAFYNKHKDVFMRQDYDESESIDLSPYFSASCYKGFGDDEKGFFSVYNTVFAKIGVEENEFEEIEIPPFGDSKSSYEEVVHNFYAFWQSFSTKKTYSWLKAFDINTAPNRRVLRLMERENKRIRDKAKKDYNETIKNLVEFVKKKDIRVKNHAILTKQAKEDRALKLKEKIRQQKLERKVEMDSYKENDWSKYSNFEKELNDIEASVTQEFGDHSSESEISDNEDLSHLFCIACNKLFKTEKSFQNHENSKKHKENLVLLKEQMLQEEEELDESDLEISDEEVGSLNEEDIEDLSNEEEQLSEEEEEEEEEELDDGGENHDKNSDCEEFEDEVKNESDDHDENFKNSSGFNGLENGDALSDNENDISDNISNQDEIISEEGDLNEHLKYANVKSKKKKKKKNVFQQHVEDDTEVEDIDSLILSKKQKKKNEKLKLLKEVLNEKNEKCDTVKKNKNENVNEVDSTKEMGGKLEEEKVNHVENKINNVVKKNDNSDEEVELISKKKSKTNICLHCKQTFNSKNKLFAHLKQTGHAVIKNNLDIEQNLVGTSKKNIKEETSRKKNKNKRIK